MFRALGVLALVLVAGWCLLKLTLIAALLVGGAVAGIAVLVILLAGLFSEPARIRRDRQAKAERALYPFRIQLPKA